MTDVQHIDQTKLSEGKVQVKTDTLIHEKRIAKNKLPKQSWEIQNMSNGLSLLLSPVIWDYFFPFFTVKGLCGPTDTDHRSVKCQNTKLFFCKAVSGGGRARQRGNS